MSSDGGGETTFTQPRKVAPGDIALPVGYRIEPVATGLRSPTGVAFDESGRPYIVESGYTLDERWSVPRLLRIEPDGHTTVIAQGGRNGPWNGVAYHRGFFYVAEGGELEGGRILRIAPDGRMSVLIQDLPSIGDHHTNGPVVGPDGWVYFGQGTATNAGVVGEDNFKAGWLKRQVDFHDTPCKDVILTGKNFASKDLRNPTSDMKVETGAFSAFGTKTFNGQVIPGRIPCNGAVMRIPIEEGRPELVAWGLRNPYGLAFAPDGRLFVTDNSYDERGSRQIFGAGDLLWEIAPETWYGWPDFHGNVPVNEEERYTAPNKEKPERLLAAPPGIPPKPAAVLGVHASADGFDFSRSESFGYVGHAFIALFGDMAPNDGKVMGPIGFKVVRVDVSSGVVTDFAVNKGTVNGPASWQKSRGLERPLAVRFDPSGTSLYVVDFGVMLLSRKGTNTPPNTGVLWRITRTDPG